MRLLWIILAALIIVPIVEIATLIAIGQVIGLGWTLILVLATSALGAWLLKREGGRAWLAFQNDLAERRPPGNTATDGLLVLIGGIFMLVPGFVSDVIGAFFILPPTRRLARAVLVRILGTRMSAAANASLFGARRVKVRYGGAPAHDQTPTSHSRRASEPGEAIEGEIIDP